MKHEMRVDERPVRNSWVFFGRCLCGWTGPDRHYLEEAEKDTGAHERYVQGKR